MIGQWQKPRLVESASRDVSLTPEFPQLSLAETLDNGLVVGWHSHDFAQVLCPSKGVVALLVRDWLSVVPEGFAALVPAGVVHTVVANTTTTLRTICVRQPESTPRDPAHAVHPKIRRLGRDALMAEGDLAGRVLSSFEAPGRDEVHSPEDALLGYLSGVPIPGDRRARPIAFRLINALHDQRTLKEWGEQFGASERTLSRIFHDEVGMSFRQWRTRVQLAETIALLLSGRSVKTASCSAGYSSPSAFIAAFRAVTGESPLKYLNSSIW
ncbi:AraC family transcriptional regulator [Caballeronia sp. dw_19]|uniref:AraC family transcriptional regulator n=1 Tax=Caballeronia sp. dw_19 TaxID=2719791 RepID=UPI001BD5EA21|nr:AraC family transcriptional regulator [Caballeronia sp. dw_19]